jgi:hypothetical protein
VTVARLNLALELLAVAVDLAEVADKSAWRTEGITRAVEDLNGSKAGRDRDRLDRKISRQAIGPFGVRVLSELCSIARG